MDSMHTIGPFILGKTLGQGTTGKVKLAFHKDTGVKVAVKIVSKEHLKLKPTMRRKMEREIAIMKLLTHPNLLRLFDVYETPNNLYLIEELVEGGELFDYLVKKGSLDPSEARMFFQQIVLALDYCHGYCVCHRDLKPENLLLSADKSIKVGDFGMAALMKPGEMLGTSCGSPHYASPEVVAGKKYDGRAADTWSCGVILYALLTGKLPFDDNNIKKLLGKVKLGLFSMPKYLPADVQDLINRMLTVDPARRITIAEIKQHRWFTKERFVREIPFVPITEQNSPPVGVDAMDDGILWSLRALGFTEKEAVRLNLQADSKTLEKAFYKLLDHHKQNGSFNKLMSKEGSRVIKSIETPLLQRIKRRPRRNSMAPVVARPMVAKPKPAAKTHIPKASEAPVTSAAGEKPKQKALAALHMRRPRSNSISTRRPGQVVKSKRNSTTLAAQATASGGTPASERRGRELTDEEKIALASKRRGSTPGPSFSPDDSPNTTRKRRLSISNKLTKMFVSKEQKADDDGNGGGNGGGGGGGGEDDVPKLPVIVSDKMYSDIVNEVRRVLNELGIKYALSTSGSIVRCAVRATFKGEDTVLKFNIEMNREGGKYVVTFENSRGDDKHFSLLAEEVRSRLKL